MTESTKPVSTVERDESRDVQIICDEKGVPSDMYCGHWFSTKAIGKRLPLFVGHSLQRFVPFDSLQTETARRVEAERQLAEFRADFEGMRKFLEAHDAEMLANICPGCHAVAPERCLPGCLDAEMAREREYEYESEYDNRDDDDGDDDE